MQKDCRGKAAPSHHLMPSAKLGHSTAPLDAEQVVVPVEASDPQNYQPDKLLFFVNIKGIKCKEEIIFVCQM